MVGGAGPNDTALGPIAIAGIAQALGSMITRGGLKHVFTKFQRLSRELRLASTLASAGVGSKAALRMVGVLLVCLQALACANILGIDEPEARVDATGGSAGSTGSIDAGAAGTADASARPFPKLQSGGDMAGRAGTSGSHLMIKGPQSVSGCPNAPTAIDLSVSGGDGMYIWQLVPEEPGFDVKAKGANQDQAVLTGTIGTKPSTVSVRVSDGSGASEIISTEIEVASVPVIEKPVLGSICPDELYARDLHASGGDEQHYVWSSDDLPASSGLTLDAYGHLAGKFSGVPLGPSQLKFTVKVADGTSCVAEPLKVSLAVSGPSASECPTISLLGQPKSWALPSLCLGGEYNQQLKASGGTPPYAWTSSVRPSGTSLDGTGKFSGTYVSGAPRPIPPAPLKVQVKDSNGRTIERSELVPVRDKCWFAYVAKSGATAQLHFFDPLLSNRKTPPFASAGEVVTDFKFSPNGRFVAYRLTTPTGTTALSVIDLFTWQQNAAAFPGVTQYAWSTDSGTLAVAYSVGQDSVLGGLDIAHANPGASSSITFPPLAPVVTHVDSVLAWFGPEPEQIAFLLNAAGGALSLRTSPLAVGAGFAAPVPHSGNLPGPIQLKSTTSGLFEIPASDFISIGYVPSDGSFATYHDDVVIAPSGQYVARADGGSLSVFGPSDDSDGDATYSAEGCDTLASWAPGRERIACARQIQGADSVAFFDLAATADPNVLALSQTGSATFQMPEQRRRLFSASGSLFAIAGDQLLSIATVANDGSVSVQGHPSSVPPSSAGSAFAELSFAPNEKLLLQHRGARLGFFDLLNPTDSETTISDALGASVECDEGFRNVSVGWCGAERPGAPFMWSPKSDLAAFQIADGTLHIFGFVGLTRYEVDAQCAGDCVVPGQFAFQP